MRHTRGIELPPDKQQAQGRAVRLEWWSIAYFVSVVIAIYLTLGASQAMKAAWIEDLLGFVPPIAFLIASRIRYRRPNDEYPYGYHRAVAVGFLVSAVALLIMGIYVIYDSVMKLAAFEHSSIGLVQPWGEPIWLGWFMIAALVWGLVPPVILGRLKMPLARELHDKVLYADAEMNRADWLTAGAAILGVVGIRYGLWWADPIAAIVIGADIVRDGVTTTRSAVGELMDRRPTAVDDSAADPLPGRVKSELEKLEWVEAADVRMREEGHVFYGDAFVVPSDEHNLTERIREATEQIMKLDWRMYDLVISPVDRLEEPQDRDGDQSASTSRSAAE